MHCDEGMHGDPIEWRDFENKQVRNGARLTKKHLVYEIHGD
jgi:hypothetical protein